MMKCFFDVSQSKSLLDSWGFVSMQALLANRNIYIIMPHGIIEVQQIALLNQSRFEWLAFICLGDDN